MKSVVVIAVTLVFMSAPQVWAQEQNLDNKSCQQLKDRIKKYDKLRKAGGKATQMENWRKRRKAAQREYRNKGCKL